MKDEGDMKKTWNLINEIRGERKNDIKPVFIIDNERIISRRIIANEFNEYFTSVASKLNQKVDENCSSDSSSNEIFANFLNPGCKNSIFLPDCTKEEISSSLYLSFKMVNQAIYQSKLLRPALLL